MSWTAAILITLALWFGGAALFGLLWTAFYRIDHNWRKRRER